MQKHSISNELLAILVCPESKSPVSIASDLVLDKINLKISEGKLTNRAGQIISKNLEAALIREDLKVIYPIVDGIPVMLIEEGITVDI